MMDDSRTASPKKNNESVAVVQAKDIHDEVTWTVIGTSVLTFLLVAGFVLWLHWSSRTKKSDQKKKGMRRHNPESESAPVISRALASVCSRGAGYRRFGHQNDRLTNAKELWKRIKCQKINVRSHFV